MDVVVEVVTVEDIKRSGQFLFCRQRRVVHDGKDVLGGGFWISFAHISVLYMWKW